MKNIEMRSALTFFLGMTVLSVGSIASAACTAFGGGAVGISFSQRCFVSAGGVICITRSSSSTIASTTLSGGVGEFSGVGTAWDLTGSGSAGGFSLCYRDSLATDRICLLGAMTGGNLEISLDTASGTTLLGTVPGPFATASTAGTPINFTFDVTNTVGNTWAVDYSAGGLSGSTSVTSAIDPDDFSLNANYWSGTASVNGVETSSSGFGWGDPLSDTGVIGIVCSDCESIPEPGRASLILLGLVAAGTLRVRPRRA